MVTRSMNHEILLYSSEVEGWDRSMRWTPSITHCILFSSFPQGSWAGILIWSSKLLMNIEMQLTTLLEMVQNHNWHLEKSLQILELATLWQQEEGANAYHKQNTFATDFIPEKMNPITSFVQVPCSRSLLLTCGQQQNSLASHGFPTISRHSAQMCIRV